MAGPRFFSLLATMLECVVWGAWLNYIVTAYQGQEKKNKTKTKTALNYYDQLQNNFGDYVFMTHTFFR